MRKQGVLVVLGHKGSGKTQLVRRFLQAVERSVCIDTIGEYGGVLIEDPWSLSDYLERAKHLERFRVAYRDTGNHSISPEQIFKMLQSLRDSWLCLEEASKWMGPSNTTSEELRWFLQYGRHNRVSVLLVARRPQELDRMGTAQADTVISFRQQEPRDLEYISKMGGPEAAQRVENLGEYEYDYVLDTHPEIREILDSISEGTSNANGSSDLDTGTVEYASGDGGSLHRMDDSKERDGATMGGNSPEGVRSSRLPIESGRESGDGGTQGGGDASSSRGDQSGSSPARRRGRPRKVAPNA